VFALPNRGYTESIRHLALTAAKQSATISLTLPFNGVPLLARPLQRIVGGANLCLVLHLFAGG
jgi:hypothetical protein